LKAFRPPLVTVVWTLQRALANPVQHDKDTSDLSAAGCCKKSPRVSKPTLTRRSFVIVDLALSVWPIACSHAIISEIGSAAQRAQLRSAIPVFPGILCDIVLISYILLLVNCFVPRLYYSPPELIHERDLHCQSSNFRQPAFDGAKVHQYQITFHSPKRHNQTENTQQQWHQP